MKQRQAYYDEHEIRRRETVKDVKDEWSSDVNEASDCDEAREANTRDNSSDERHKRQHLFTDRQTSSCMELIKW